MPRAERASSWRLILDGAAAGSWNLAVDEAILDAYAEADGERAPTLRLYSWDPPALSLGRAQSADQFPALDGAPVDLVRRPTGGAAVLHHRERTYSVCARLRARPFAGGVLDNYRAIAAALAEAMGRLGAPAASAAPVGRVTPSAVCFESLSQHEIRVGGRKLIGSAQSRRRGAFLQHGSIPLDFDPALHERVFGCRAHQRSFTDLREATGRGVSEQAVDEALVAAFAARFGVELSCAELTAAERERAEALARGKYSGRDWTRGGR